MKRMLLFIIALLISSAVFADQTSLLWKYSNSDTTVYILGSIHLTDNDMLPLKPSVYEAWNECSTLVMEVDLNEAIAASQMLVMQYMVMPDSKRLSDFYTEDELSGIDQALSAAGIPLSLVQTWYPWLLEVTIVSLEYAKAGLVESGIDMHFAQMAGQENKTVIGLESAEEQFKILAGMSLEYQAESLLSTVESLPELGNDINELIESYKSGNLDKLEELIMEDSDDSPESAELLERLFSGRNKNWAGQIEKMIKKGGTYFIVVGAGHLLAEESVIELLAEKGYRFSN